MLVNRPRLSLSGSGDIVVKRMTIPNQTIVTTAGAIVALVSIDSSSVQANPASEWASFAARYQQYRVRGMSVIAHPVYPVNTATVGHSQIFFADYLGAAAPASAAQVLSDERAVVFSTCRPITFLADWGRNPNARLWNPTSAAIPAANRIGISYASSTVAGLLLATATYYVFVIEFIVELRGSQ